MVRLLAIISLVVSLTRIAQAQIAQESTSGPLDPIGVQASADSVLDDEGSAYDPYTFYEYLEGVRLTTTPFHDTRLQTRTRAARSAFAYDEHGYIGGSYLGDPYALYDRIRFTSPVVVAAFAQQKQAWEPKFADRLNGYAALASRQSITPTLALTHAVVGDFSLAWGSGLLFGEGQGASRTYASATATEERTYGTRGTTASDPHTMRGIAAEVAGDHVRVSLFGSARSLNATVYRDSISAITTSDYHRTSSELAQRNAAQERSAGGRVQYEAQDSITYFAMGASGYVLGFDHPFLGIAPSSSAASVDAVYFDPKLRLSAEAAASSVPQVSNIAVLSTATFYAAPNLSFTVLYRRIPGSFSGQFGASMGDDIATQRGTDRWYAGFAIPIVDTTLTMNGYGLLQHNGDLSYTTEYLLRAAVALPAFAVSTYLRSAFRDAIGPSAFVPVRLSNVQTLHCDLDHPLASWLSSRSRVVATSSAWNLKSISVLESERLNCRINRSHRLTLSVTRFDCAGIDPLYDYATTLPGFGSLNYLTGSGERVTLSGSWLPNERTAVSVGADLTLYDEKQSIGSDLSKRTGSSALMLLLQLDLSL